MKAVVKINRTSGPPGTEIRDVETPRPREGEVLIRVAAAGICGTDRHIYQWNASIQQSVRPPLIYGHEFCGFVENFGPNTPSRDFHVGDYVSAEAHRTCGECAQCRGGVPHQCVRTYIMGLHVDGAFAEFVAVPIETMIALPLTIPPRVAAFLDALGTVVHVTELTELLGKSVLITGLGPMGAMAATIAHAAGARRIIVADNALNMLEPALTWARNSGASAFHPINVRGLPFDEISRCIHALERDGVDVVIDVSGAASAINVGLDAIRMGGEMMVLGFPAGHAVEIQDYTRNVIFKGVRIRAVLGRRIFSTWEKMLGLLQHGLDVEWITPTVFQGLETFHDAVAAFADHTILKPVIFPESEAAVFDRLASS